MLILDRASENKLEELVLVSRKLNGVLREIYPRVHKIEPDRAALLWCAIDDEIEKRQKQIQLSCQEEISVIRYMPKKLILDASVRSGPRL